MMGTWKGFQGICHILFLSLHSAYKGYLCDKLLYWHWAVFYTGALVINGRNWQRTLVYTQEGPILCVNYLHLLHFSSVVLLWEPPLCWSGRALLGCALGSNPQARECCTQSCPGKSSPSLPARGGSAGPSAEAVLQDKWRNHLNSYGVVDHEMTGRWAPPCGS